MLFNKKFFLFRLKQTIRVILPLTLSNIKNVSVKMSHNRKVLYFYFYNALNTLPREGTRHQLSFYSSVFDS